MEGKGLRGAKVRAALALATLTVGALFVLPAQALVAGEVAFIDPNNDGYVNISEAGGLDSASVPVHRLSPGAAWEDAGIDTVSGEFVDGSNVNPNPGTGGGQCGPFSFATFSSSDASEYLNAGCFGAFADGSTIKWVVTWTDTDDGNGAVVGQDTIIKDVTAPTASISLSDAYVSTPDADAGVPVSWNVSGTGPGVTVTAANDGQAAPTACTWSGLSRATTGAITPACFAALADGPIDVFVSGSDDAGNAVTATDPNTLTLDRSGSLTGSLAFLNAPINASNVGGVQLKITGTAPAAANAPYTLSIDDATNTPATAPVTTAGTLDGTGVATITTALSGLNDGGIIATAKIFDADGNATVLTASTTKDVVVPGSALIFSPAQNSLNNAGVLKASGAAEQGNTVQIWVDKSPLAPVLAVEGKADNNGAWTLTLPTRTAHKGFGQSGTYKIYAVTVDDLGNVSAPTAPVVFDLDLDLPTVVIDAPANQSIIEHDAPLVISGTAAETNDQAFAKLFAVEVDVFSPTTPDANASVVPNTDPSEITYSYKLALGKSVFKRNADCKGTDALQTPCGMNGPHDATWSLDLSFLAPGAYTIQVRALDIALNWSAQMAQVNIVKL